MSHCQPKDLFTDVWKRAIAVNQIVQFPPSFCQNAVWSIWCLWQDESHLLRSCSNERKPKNCSRRTDVRMSWIFILLPGRGVLHGRRAGVPERALHGLQGRLWTSVDYKDRSTVDVGELLAHAARVSPVQSHRVHKRESAFNAFIIIQISHMYKAAKHE